MSPSSGDKEAFQKRVEFCKSKGLPVPSRIFHGSIPDVVLENPDRVRVIDGRTMQEITPPEPSMLGKVGEFVVGIADSIKR